MSDELKRAADAFKRQDPVVPRADARKAAIENAMMQFAAENAPEKENSTQRQGIGFGVRLKERGNKILTALKRRRPMNPVHMNFKHILAGGASFAVLALVVTNINIILPDGPEFAPVPVKRNNAPVSELVKPDISAPLSQPKTPSTSTGSKITAQKPDNEAGRPAAEMEMRLEKKELADSVGQVAESVVSAPAPVAGYVAKRPVKRRQKLKRLSGVVPLGSIAAGGDLRVRKDDMASQFYQDQGRDRFSRNKDNPTRLTSEDPLSTFSVDVDTASYAFMRASLNRGVLPQKDAVRIEELVNYFDYGYAAPTDRVKPFSANVSIMPTPWNTNTKLMRIGIKGFNLPKTEAPRANLVFLIDTSGSMNAPNKLPLLRNSFKLLLQSLKPDDTVAIVTYAGSAGAVLEPTKVADKNKILAALDRLRSGGSTAGAAGIRQAYQLAERQLDKVGVNRVILATDGDFNVGISNPDELKSFVERKRKSGVSLSVLGFGAGNYNDELMQTLAQNGNGNAAYIDTLSEARKVLVEQAGATLFTIAKDVKIQVEFNPATVGSYRLIGYETRQLKREDFNNDKVDAGDIGAGHSVTALYEISARGVAGGLVDELRYKTKKPTLPSSAVSDNSSEYAFVKIRYKQPKSSTSQLITIPVTKADEKPSLAQAPKNARFAAAVAAFGQILKGGRYTGAYSYDDVIALAQSAKGEDRFGYRAEFINLVRLAKSAAAMEPQK